jgi:hypothetical protein
MLLTAYKLFSYRNRMNQTWAAPWYSVYGEMGRSVGPKSSWVSHEMGKAKDGIPNLAEDKHLSTVRSPKHSNETPGTSHWWWCEQSSLSQQLSKIELFLLRVAMLAHDSIIYFIVIFSLCALPLGIISANLNYLLFISMPYYGYTFKCWQQYYNRRHDVSEHSMYICLWNMGLNHLFSPTQCISSIAVP